MIRTGAAPTTTIIDICYAQQQIAHITNIFLNFLQQQQLFIYNHIFIIIYTSNNIAS